MLVILLFLLYSAVCFWVIFRDGAEVLEGWKSLIAFDLFAAMLSANELRFFAGISWLACLVGVLVYIFRGTGS